MVNEISVCLWLVFTTCIICIASSEEYLREPKITVDPDGEIPVVEGFGGNVDILEEDDVLILTRDNFLHIVSPKDIILVEFYTPWCGHCQALAPEYAKAATSLKKEGIRLAKVDATKEVELSKDHLVSGYPTLKLFKKGHPVEDYHGERTADALVSYMRQHADPNYIPPASAVMVLTSSNFSKTVKGQGLILVEFYAPWCRHCKNFEPEFEAAAKDLAALNIPLAKIDGVAEKEITDEHGVNGYPSLFVFRRGRKFDYKGPRDAKGIVAFMTEQRKSPSQEVRSDAELRNGIAKFDVTVVGCFSEKSEDFVNEFMGAANELRGRLVFLHTFDGKVAKKFDLKMDTVNILMPDIYFSEYEEKTFTYSKTSGSYREIAQWISRASVPLVGQRTMANRDFKYIQRPLLVVYYDVNFSHQYLKDTQFIRGKVLPVAAANRDIVFALSNEEEFEEDLKSLGLEDSGESVNVAILTQGRKFPMEPEEEFTAEILEDFLEKFKAGKLKPFLRSQPIPKRQDSAVRVVVANNFQTEVIKSKKDVLIEFYAPWCGHCRSLEPIYKKLANQLAMTNPDVIVAKMDASANDVPTLFKVDGFPTIYLVRADDKESPIQFSGARTLKALKEFVSQESSIMKDIYEDAADPSIKSEL